MSGPEMLVTVEELLRMGAYELTPTEFCCEHVIPGQLSRGQNGEILFMPDHDNVHVPATYYD